MSYEESERKLAAVMFTDIVGYTALTQSDEAQALEVMQKHNKLLRPYFTKYHGREIKTIGDAFLVEFDSALDALLCAIGIQESLHDYNTSANDLWKIKLRIGIHVGDVVHKDNDLFGDAVNIASRIQPLAEPEGICVSDQVFGQVRNKVLLSFQKLAPRELKNIKYQIELYKVVMRWEQVGISLPDEANKSRIAVLPFANMSPDPNDEYFADGMTEELIDRLAQVKSLRVISRTSVMKYKGEKKGALDIGKELSAGSLIEGSVRKAGNRIRVTVQLINGGSEEHLWSSHYDGNIDDVFAVQSEIAEKVASELKVQLLQSEKKAIEKKPTENMDAYANFLRGTELFREGSEQTARDALKLFESAVKLDPSFARAYVGVAVCHQWLANDGYESSDVMFPAVKASLRRALELDPDLAEAHSSLAMTHLYEDNLSGTEKEATRALELNPSLPEAYRILFEVAGLKGTLDAMVGSAEAAYRLDPIRPENIGILGYAYFVTGREKEAVEHWRKTELLNPVGTYRHMTDYYLSKGDIPKARELHAKIEKLRPTDPWVTYMGGFIDATAGDREKALQAIKKIEEAKMGPVAYNYVAYVYHALGDMDRYFENMNRACEEHMLIGTVVMYSPLLAKAKEDPRYRELIENLRRQVGLAK